MKWLLAALTAFCLIQPALSSPAALVAEDPVIEQRLNHIAEELRCLVCQNESLAGSRAELAMDLKREVRDLIKAGKTDAQVKEFLVTRYGDFVLYRPPLKPTTYLLWAVPFVLQLVGIALLIRFLRRRNRKDAETVPDEPQKERVDAP